MPPDCARLLAQYAGRTGVVLSGGGARGAYEAGVLLAFQDANLPTHILAATSVGSINAASYAAHSPSTVGNAESLVASWSHINPPAVGIDWFRYILLLTGLVAASAGFGNLVREWLRQEGVFFHLHSPKWTWFALGITGLATLFLYDHLPYLGHVIKHGVLRRHWKPDVRKTWFSVVANLVVWGCGVFFLSVSHLHLTAQEIFDGEDSDMTLMVTAGLLLAGALAFFFRKKINFFSHKFLRMPLRSGLFPNFERTRFLREHIPAEGLRASPIRVVMTAADVHTGSDRCFTNAAQADLLADPGVEPSFVRDEMVRADDLLLAVIASSAFPIVYEAVPMQGGTWTDGGIVSNQPIRPAIRLGADVLFLVMVEPRSQTRSEIKTFLDLGVRAIDILMAQNLKTDLKILSNVNSWCEFYAEGLGIRPEQINLHVGARRYRYMKAITVEPTETLSASVLDFDGDITAPAIVQGYRDGSRAVLEFTSYLRGLPADLPRHEVTLVAEALNLSRAAAR
ncbi:MAG TPA: patatin-like phospholipase family protein [Terriglobales bacterium]|nr:patatin-like phospholipase family protein [Terriglobales bacterium]